MCSVCPWCICTGIASAFIYASFSASMRADMPCFTGTNLACLVATSCYSLDSCSTLICLNPNAFHTLYILFQFPCLCFACSASCLSQNSSQPNLIKLLTTYFTPQWFLRLSLSIFSCYYLSFTPCAPQYEKLWTVSRSLQFLLLLDPSTTKQSLKLI